MDMRQVEYFAVVATQGSYKKAAEDLYISRQALSKTIKNLEQEVGRTLISAQDNHVQLTEEGEQFLQDAQPVLEAYHEFTNKYARNASDTRRVQTLSISMSHGTNRVMPTDWIDTFRLLHPNTLLTIEEVTSEETVKSVELSEAEIGIIGSVPRYLSKFDAVLVAKTDLYVFAPRGVSLKNNNYVSYEDLDGKTFVTFGKKNHLHSFFAEECKSRGVRPDIALTTSDVSLLIRTAIQQEAFFFGFSSDIEDIKVEGHILLPLEEGSETGFGTYAIKRKGAVLSSAAREFWELISSSTQE